MENKKNYQRASWRFGLFLFIALFLMWPMLKGTYYKNFGDEHQASTVSWQESYQAAVTESQKTGKPILLDFSASWCPPCQVMKHEVWTDGKVGEVANESYVSFEVDVDLPESRSLAQKYQVTGIPDIVIINSKGQLLKRTGFLSASQMVEFLAQAK